MGLFTKYKEASISRRGARIARLSGKARLAKRERNQLAISGWVSLGSLAKQKKKDDKPKPLPFTSEEKRDRWY